jgi:tetratricopeptide (TPR) repeat protein
MCATHLCLGMPQVTRDHMKQAAAVYDPALHAANTATFGLDPGVATQAFGAVALWILGQPAEALAASERSLNLARQLDQPSSLAMAMHFAAMLHQMRGDAPATAHWALRTIDLAAEEGFSFWLAGGQIFRGWARVALLAGAGAEADADGGIEEIRRGLDAWLATGSRTYHTYYLGLLADALLRLDRPTDALPPLDEALAAAHTLPEGLYEAELHRLRASALSHASVDEASNCLLKAIDVAHVQGARWFEWRASCDLASLLRRRGKPQEADSLLAATAWF